MTFSLLSKYGALCLSLVLFTHSAASAESPVFEALTFNVRYQNKEDGKHYWPHRVELVGQVLAERPYAVIALQEVERHQLDALRPFTEKDYLEVGVGRDDGAHKGEYSALLLRKSALKMVRSGTFWLSDTPDKPGSTTWGNVCPRICTWAVAKWLPAGREVLLANTHWDNASEVARLNSAAQMAKTLPQLANGLPILLMGDFNCSIASPALSQLVQSVKLQDTFLLANQNPSPEKSGTFHVFKGKTDGPRIDHILTAPGWATSKCEILHNRGPKPAQLWPSDHFPVRWAGILVP